MCLLVIKIILQSKKSSLTHKFYDIKSYDSKFMILFLFNFYLQFFSKTTERFVHGVDSFLDTLWKLWVDLLDVMGIDCKSGSHFLHLCHIMSPISYRHCLCMMQKSRPKVLSLLSLLLFPSVCFLLSPQPLT